MLLVFAGVVGAYAGVLEGRTQPPQNLLSPHETADLVTDALQVGAVQVENIVVDGTTVIGDSELFAKQVTFRPGGKLVFRAKANRVFLIANSIVSESVTDPGVITWDVADGGKGQERRGPNGGTPGRDGSDPGQSGNDGAPGGVG